MRFSQVRRAVILTKEFSKRIFDEARICLHALVCLALEWRRYRGMTSTTLECVGENI